MERRDFLTAVCGLAAGYKTAAASCASFKPAANPLDHMPLPMSSAVHFQKPKGPVEPRRCISRLNDAEQQQLFQDLSKAYGVMQEAPVKGKLLKTSLPYQAWMHQSACGGKASHDVHNNWSFLPWHRGFIYFHERIIRCIVGDRFRMPAWDWDEQGKVPDFYRKWADDNNSMRCNDSVDIKPCTLEAWLLTQKWSDFVGTPSLGASASGGPHAWVHSHIGGLMVNFPTAASDPLFYTHHANVDRFWWYWKKLGQKPPAGSNWGTTKYYFYDEHENLVYLTADDLTDEGSLGYEYLEQERPQTCLYSVNPLDWDVAKYSLEWLKLVTQVTNLGSRITNAVVKGFKCAASLDIPIRVHAALPGIDPTSSYFIGLKGSVQPDDHYLIGQFGAFGSGNNPAPEITATACIDAGAIKFIRDHWGLVTLVYGETDDNMNWMEKEHPFPGTSILELLVP